ncbi:hypothetical protein [Microbacterium sp. EST19A]|uniref:hypothetical protein n=1 Tax=Microbacterium sp. EST19A TaxID=2862681 RepID=UPI001CBBC31D|nr:hypothetical protein [Microbacterium sp. EST19A]
MPIITAFFSMPWVSLIVAAIIAVGITVTPAWNARRASRERLVPTAGLVARYSPEHRTLGITAIVVIVAFVAENLISGYALDLADVVAWWRYPMPMITASVGVGILLAIIATRGSAPVEQPVISARRTWLTFSARTGSVGAGLTLLALSTITILAGLASSNIGDGPYVFLEIEVPNETIDPIRPWFYGWAYGVPVLICTAALIAVTVGALHANASRSFMRPQTVIAEQRQRRAVATGITRISTSAALLTLAGAVRFIADAGSVAGLTIQGDLRSDSYTAYWRYGEVAAVGGAVSPLLEIAAFVLLLLVTAQLYPSGCIAQPSVDAESHAERETAQ